MALQDCLEKKQLLFRMNTVAYFNLKIEFLDQLLLLLVVKTVMGHKTNITPSSFLFLLFSAFRMPVVCLLSAYAGPCSQGFLCLPSACCTLSSPGETGSRGLLHKGSSWSSGCCQEARQRHNVALVTLFC